jgi:hypothetical protein
VAGYQRAGIAYPAMALLSGAVTLSLRPLPYAVGSPSRTPKRSTSSGTLSGSISSS